MMIEIVPECISFYSDKKENSYRGLHSVKGPAKIYENGVLEYAINAEYLTKEQWNTHPLRLEYLIETIILGEQDDYDMVPI